ncbi:MAG TPA: carboxypeptidase-like regulatory domain-containing protein [Bryobacteraceae bacterium]|jgi:hypothetical protein|nr:carboxypeptidase-like regulatory domain-containing protein [Bryobacteraceae bacterium]
MTITTGLLFGIALTMSVQLCAENLFKGTVNDSEGASIGGATILIRWDSSGSAVGLKTNIGIKEDVVLRSGPDGTFSVQLPPGFYDVFISSMAFTPVCRKIRIRDGGTVTFNPRLPIDALVSEELGTKYPSGK